MRSRLSPQVALTAALFILVAANRSEGESFSALQTRFFPMSSGGVDVELSRFRTYAALADWTEGNSVTVFDKDWEPLWRHRQSLYWGGTYKQAGVLRFSPDESFLLCTAFRTDNDIALLDPATGQPLAILTDHSDTVQALDLSDDGSLLVSYAQDELFLWRRSGTTFIMEGRFPEPLEPVTSLALSRDGTLLALAQNHERDRRLTLYRISQGRFEPIGSHGRDESYLSREFGGLRFSPDGAWLAAAYHDGIHLWRLPPGNGPFAPVQSIEDIELGSVLSLAFSPDGNLLLSGHHRDVGVYRRSGTAWGAETTFPSHQGAANDFAFTEDGTLLALAGRGETTGLGLWAVAGAGPSPVGRLLTLLEHGVSAVQRAFLSTAAAERILAALNADALAPRDMFETAEEYRLRLAGAKRAAAAAMGLEVERLYGARRDPLPGGASAVIVALQTQGRYDADSKTYSFRFLGEDASAVLERDAARNLFLAWQDARVRAVRTESPDGTDYGDFTLLLPGGGAVPVSLSRNPFTADSLDPYGARIPSFPVGTDLLIRDLSIEGIFPALLHYYDRRSIGSFELRNIGSSPISALSVRFFIPGLMRNPMEAEIPKTLGVGLTRRVDLRARLDPEAMTRMGAGSASAEVTVSYVSRGTSYRETLARPIAVLNRNAVRWKDDRAAAAFMTVADPALLRWSAAASAMAGGPAADALTRNLQSAVAAFEALGAVGLSYVVDPASPYQALSRDGTMLDHIRFPMETLDQKSGDCDDLSVLYGSLLESVGVPAAFIATPGHILSAFDLGIPASEAVRIFGTESGLFFREGRTWIPMETTLVGGDFEAARQAGARIWRSAETAGTSHFFTAREAWEHYPPAEFPSPGGIALPVRDQVSARYAASLAGFRRAVMDTREKELLEALARAPTAAAENRLGVLYAQFGLLDKASERFSRALASGEYLPALINTAGVLTLTGDHLKARTFLFRARELSPKDPRVLIALAFSYRRSGDEDAAAAAYDQAARIAPDLAARYPLDGAGGSAAVGGAVPGGVSRASSADEFHGSVWAE